jgi:ubiquinone biosynthesis monooxygenase Coq7
MNQRDYTPFDHLLIHLDQAVRTVFGHPAGSGRDNPAAQVPPAELVPEEQRQAAQMMRVNHTGEVCAQALYQGQALTAQRAEVRELLEQAAREENDHLDWCEARLAELGSHTSRLNPLFYAGSFCIGALNGVLGDRWNLGFLAETERQVVAHLAGHLHQLPEQDQRSRAIVTVMQEDEDRHAVTARTAGGTELPPPVRWLMQAAARVMTSTTRWV